MRDYSNYREEIDMFEWSAKKTFELQLQGNEGETVSIDNKPDIRVVIQEHTNPLNELKEDRKILIPSGVSVCRGSTIMWNGEEWLIVNDVSNNDDNGVYKKCKMVRAFSKLKWQDKESDDIYELPCIATAQLLYTLGITDNKNVVVPDGRMNLTVVWSEITDKISVGMRFCFNSYKIFKVTYIDTITMPKLMSIMLEEDVIREDLDDLTNNLAYNGDIQPTKPSTDTGWTFEIIGDSSITQNASKTYTVRIWNNGIEDTSPTQTVIWELIGGGSDIAYLDGYIPVSRTATLHAVKGVNYVTLKATLSVDTSKVVEKKITVKGLF